MATIQWFPGHMSKARRQVQENLKHVDFVTILVDARLPLSSQNPMLTKIVGDKPKLLILNKADLADSNRTKEYQPEDIQGLVQHSFAQADTWDLRLHCRMYHRNLLRCCQNHMLLCVLKAHHNAA